MPAPGSIPIILYSVLAPMLFGSSFPVVVSPHGIANTIAVPIKRTAKIEKTILGFNLFL